MSSEESLNESRLSPEAEKAFAEFLIRNHGAERTSFEEFCKRKPELREELEELYARWQVPSATQSGLSFGELLRQQHGHEVDPGVSLDAKDDAGATPVSDAQGGSPASSVLRRLGSLSEGGDRYRIRDEIARGGMGAILRVWDETLRRTLAMKVILSKDEESTDVSTGELDPKRVSRFLEEAQITGQLDHPGIVPVHELGLDSSGRVFFTMRLVRGKDLRTVFTAVHENDPEWSLTRALGIMLRVCEAMAFAHEKGVIHRDLKPANIMVGRFGETYVMDWGLAKVLGAEDSKDVRPASLDPSASFVRTERARDAASSGSPLVTMDGDIVGTACYMSPEQARGRLEDIGPRSDVYSVGSMLYELFTGQMPYVKPDEKISPHAVLGMLIAGPPTPVYELAKAVPAELIAICEKAMARDADLRYESMLGMAQDLRAYLEGRVVQAYETGALAEFKKWIDRNRGLALATASAVVVALAGLGGVAWVQAQANEDLKLKNQEVVNARDEALTSERLAIERGEALSLTNEELVAAREEARASAQAARRLSYAANIASASASLRAGDATDALLRLGVCEVEFRDWEWHRLSRLVDESLASYGPYEKALPCVAISPDGSTIAAGTTDGRVIVIDAGTGESLRTIEGHEQSVTGIEFTLDGLQLVSGSYDRTVKVWDLRTGEPVRTLGRHRGFVTSIDLSRDGTRVATGAGDKKVRVFDLASGEEVTVLSGHRAPVNAVSFGPRGKRVASGSNDRTARIWDIESGEELHVLEGHLLPVAFAEFSPDGTRLATGSNEWASLRSGRSSDDALRLWDTRTGELAAVDRSHDSGIADAKFTTDGTRLVSVSADRTVRVWDFETATSRAQLGHTDKLTAAAVAPDGRRALSVGTQGVMRIWDLEGSSTRVLVGHRLESTSLAYHPEGTHVASGSADGTVRVWDPRAGALVANLRGHQKDAEAVVFLGDGSRVATASEDGTARIWDLETRAEVLKIEVGEELTALAGWPDGSRIAVGSDRNVVTVWDAATGEEVARLDGGETEDGIRRAIRSVAVHPEGTTLLVASKDGTVRLWDTASWEERGRFGDVGRWPVATWSPNGEKIALGSLNGQVRICDAESLDVEVLLERHTAEVRDLAFSPDGKRLVSAALDQTVRVWDPIAEESLLALQEGAGDPVAVAFDPSGQQLAAAYGDGDVRIWPTAPAREHYEAHVELENLRLTVVDELDRLFEERTDIDAIVGFLSADPSLSAEQRRAAVDLARLVQGPVDALERDCWQVVKRPTRDRISRHVAFWSALRLRAERDQERYISVLGMAFYRIGRYQDAVDTLEVAAQMREDKTRGRPDSAAFRAMALFELDRIEEAFAAREELRELMRVPILATQSDYQLLLREVESKLAAADAD